MKEDRILKGSGNQKGMTLIELVFFILVAGIVMVGVLGAFVLLMNLRGSPPEHIVKASFLAQQKVEEVTQNPFPSITAPLDQTILDYAGETGYTMRCVIEYVDSNLSPAPPGTQTNYKRISVTVTEPMGQQVSLMTLVTKRYYDDPQG